MAAMEVTNMGIQMASGVAQFAGLPIQSAADVSNAIANYRTPLSNVGAVSQNYLSLATGGSMINPNTTLKVGAQTMASNLSTATQVAQGNQQAAFAGATSMLNFSADVYGADQALAAAKVGAKATERAGIYQGIGNIIGGIF